MVFSPALRPFLQRRPEALEVLEIEPQTMWLADDPFAGPFFEFTPGIEAFAALPGHKLVHSVAVPLGGTRPSDPAQLAMLAKTAARLQSPWVSEHLSVAGTPHHAAGFLLPPIQTEEGVEIAARNIRAFADAIGRPIAIETGVAYFRRKHFEMPDGEFVARVAQAADCGILLDLHNLYCNERNGRILLDDFLGRIPADRVWEIHLAGGVEVDGFWLDSHSGAMPDALARKAIEVVRGLPNLGAVNFEIYDTYLERLDHDAFDMIVDQLRAIWEEAGRATADAARPRTTATTLCGRPDFRPNDWESGLTEAVWKADPSRHPCAEDERPLKLYAWLARSFRGSMLARALPRMMRYLLLRDGDAVERRLQRYYADEAPKLYTPLEAEAFRLWLSRDGESDPLALALLDYDMAFMKIVREGRPQIVTFPGNPGPVFEALAAAELPALSEPPEWEIEIVPDSFTIEDFATNATGS
jgi:uncharacterized protein (UPF0276 family)